MFQVYKRMQVCVCFFFQSPRVGVPKEQHSPILHGVVLSLQCPLTRIKNPKRTHVLAEFFVRKDRGISSAVDSTALERAKRGTGVRKHFSAWAGPRAELSEGFYLQERFRKENPSGSDVKIGRR